MRTDERSNERSGSTMRPPKQIRCWHHSGSGHMGVGDRKRLLGRRVLSGATELMNSELDTPSPRRSRLADLITYSLK